MRRPAKTAKQRAHDRQERALLRLRRAAVRLTNHVDASANFDVGVEAELSHALEIAAYGYANALSRSERRRLGRPS